MLPSGVVIVNRSVAFLGNMPEDSLDVHSIPGFIKRSMGDALRDSGGAYLGNKTVSMMRILSRLLEIVFEQLRGVRFEDANTIALHLQRHHTPNNQLRGIQPKQYVVLENEGCTQYHIITLIQPVYSIDIDLLEHLLPQTLHPIRRGPLVLVPAGDVEAKLQDVGYKYLGCESSFSVVYQNMRTAQSTLEVLDQRWLVLRISIVLGAVLQNLFNMQGNGIPHHFRNIPIFEIALEKTGGIPLSDIEHWV
ncbi:hypothetical protein GLOTRDRAFT_93572 [Gloeophyllum trabeum ATCC 11539]|uniref:Uncharacterized protein n=1 Tax=Gloeophyllum trabeum (strain ATCC 11539 / FP-39264 / Madison 617) TaxID=670483 RepID=S7Q675_GLOTA|nr:uncharacterized protein GLOTRDRAFT_93572 [Gloeophyllum trabeum ATCC 11539]EPQ54987.1 hypothetical protein GLOTRDRAFT_93572 [Gloeophyllum trabeum ATCC 11539]